MGCVLRVVHRYPVFGKSHAGYPIALAYETVSWLYHHMGKNLFLSGVRQYRCVLVLGSSLFSYYTGVTSFLLGNEWLYGMAGISDQEMECLMRGNRGDVYVRPVVCGKC